MKKYLNPKNNKCLWIIYICFFWTGSSYLSWLYHLADFISGIRVDLATEVVGYLFQALGIFLYSMAVRKGIKLRWGNIQIFAVVTDMLLTLPATLSKSFITVMISGYCMNILHGIIAGIYLFRLAAEVKVGNRAFVFGIGYGAASASSFLLSLTVKGNFLKSPVVLIVYTVLAALAVFILKDGEEDEKGRFIEEKAGTDKENVTIKLIILTGITIFILSFVKNMGFSFPYEEIKGGISLEMTRLFYALGLVIAGYICDMDRKYAAVLCVASLCLPFLMIILSSEIGTSIVIWMLNYFLFAFFTVFRVILFSDISSENIKDLWISGYGLLFGRIGDAIGTMICILIDSDAVLIITSSVLFVASVLSFFTLYHKLYAVTETVELNEKRRFEGFIDKYSFSEREKEVMVCLIEGRSNTEIASLLYISESTVKFHVHNLLKKTECENRRELLTLYRQAAG
ncbi:MAG: helix-turn-helix transcriptional regulator [Lachnospiraceae bacterium]|nr:helix-turn-helix transcriptional regulator [Lachnospiraceae bacterium]